LKKDDLLQALNTAPETVEFTDVISVITECYEYTPTEFKNGVGESAVINPAGTNEGSCKIFYFAKINNLGSASTLALFGQFYRDDVLNDPDGNNHQNIRQFIRHGMAGIQFESEALTVK